MNIQHFEKGFHYTDQELLYVARKLGKLATYCKALKDESSSIRVEAERRPTQKKRDEIKMMITVELPGRKLFRAESRKNDVTEAIDRCMDKLEPQVKKYKELRSGLSKVKAKRR